VRPPPGPAALVVNAARRARNGNKHLPARAIDVSCDAASALEFARVAMARHHFTPHGPVVEGAWMFRYSTLADEFLSDILGLGLIFRFFGRSNEHARIAVWTEPLPAATRVTVSLVTGIFQAPAVHSTITELIDDLSAAGVLLQAGEPFSGIDLPANSPGQPFPRRRARQEARRR